MTEHRVGVIKVRGMCGLSYRGEEALASNIMCTAAWRVGGNRGTSAEGRVFLVHQLSEDTINMLQQAVFRQMMKTSIAEDVRQAGTFSVQVDSTTDINTMDRRLTIVRNVPRVIHERLIIMLD